MRFRNLTRACEIGANCYNLVADGHQIVIDSGMHPGHEGYEALPHLGLLKDNSVQSIIVSHAHHDHIGSLPVLQRDQKNSQVFMTEFTGEVASAMLHNSVNVMTRQRVELGTEEYPLYTHRELDDLVRQWNYVRLKKPIELGREDVTATFYDAGHILGSSGVLFKSEGKSLFYTGDVCFEAQTLALAADFPTEGVDILVMETTRGDYARPAEYTRRREKERLADLIRETHAGGGSVLIPVFALGKSQELLMMLHEMVEHDLLPPVGVYLGGLAAKITKLTDTYASRTTRGYPGFQLLKDNHMIIHETGKVRQSKAKDEINPGCIYALSSGMMSEHTGSYNLAPLFMIDPRNAIAFVGFTAPDSPAYLLRNAKTGDQVQLDPKKDPITLKARVAAFDFSAHATREQLMTYATKVAPSKILLVHGDVPAQDWFQAQLKVALPHTEVLRPQPNEWIDL